MIDDGCSEGVPLPAVRNRGIKRGPRHAYRLCADTDAAAPEVAERNPVPLAFFSEPGLPNWNPDADFTEDDEVNVLDLGVMKQSFFAAPGPSALPNPCAGN